MQSRTRSLPSALVRKMRSPQMTGVESAMPGIGSFQTMFFFSLHSTGSLVSLQMPSLVGPRHCGQLSARTFAVLERVKEDRKKENRKRENHRMAGFLSV